MAQANHIAVYFHCRKCAAEKPLGVSPAAFSALDVGLTPVGVQVWCRRHDENVAHIDFEGAKHPLVLPQVKQH